MNFNFTPLDDDHPVVVDLSKEDEIAKRFRLRMDEYGLYDWKFEFSNDIHTMGWCWYKEKIIKFSKRYTHHGWDEIEDTILHEIAHALVGPDVKSHGYEWRNKAREIGARPKTCAESHVKPKDVPKKMFYLECSDCKQRWYRHRLQAKMIGRRSRCCHAPLKGFKITVRR